MLVSEPCALCGRKPESEAHFNQGWLIVSDRGADAPYCPDCIESLRVKGWVTVPRDELGLVWLRAGPRGER